MAQVYLASGKHCAEAHVIRTVLVQPSAGSWVCVFTDSTGKTVFSANGVNADTRDFQVNINADAFNMTTATNLTGVTLYT
jgi:hypothetical protein